MFQAVCSVQPLYARLKQAGFLRASLKLSAHRETPMPFCAYMRYAKAVYIESVVSALYACRFPSQLVVCMGSYGAVCITPIVQTCSKH